MSRIYLSAIGLCTLIPWPIASADPSQPLITITAISSDSHPFQGAEFLGDLGVTYNILNLDAVNQIERSLSKGLPADEAQARAIVENRIVQIGQLQLEEAIRDAYLPLAAMFTYGFDRYPVILFDQQAVVYGVTDLSQAYEQYINWLQANQGDIQ